MLHATRPAPTPARDESPSPPPPTKASLKAWWTHFKFAQRTRAAAAAHNPITAAGGPPGLAAYNYNYLKDDAPHPVFGAPLHESLKYASVQISTANANGELYVWGDIPVVVAKCGLYLKENATEVEGTFRVSGSNKRMRDLQALFETPPKYGKNLDWKKEVYTPHDVASVFRRYLTMMPEPVIPYNCYSKFREALSVNQTTDETIRTYKQLIRSMPRQNQYLLLYVLDLLSVFARKSDKNLMTATNLAVIFRPGLINHPTHEMSPHEHRLSQEVLEFLIEHQDWFMLDVPPPPPVKSIPVGSGGGGITPGPQRRSSSPQPTVVSSLAEPGWRLVEKPSTMQRERDPSPSGPPPVTVTVTGRPGSPRTGRGGRRRSSSASGDAVSPGGSAGAALGNTSTTTTNMVQINNPHVRIASAGNTGTGSNGGSGQSPIYPGASAVAVTRSRTLPARSRTGHVVGSSGAGAGAGALSRDDVAAQRRADAARAEAAAAGRNVLKKQKRSSVQPQSTTQAFGGSAGAGWGS